MNPDRLTQLIDGMNIAEASHLQLASCRHLLNALKMAAGKHAATREEFND